MATARATLVCQPQSQSLRLCLPAILPRRLPGRLRFRRQSTLRRSLQWRQLVGTLLTTLLAGLQPRLRQRVQGRTMRRWRMRAGWPDKPLSLQLLPCPQASGTTARARRPYPRKQMQQQRRWARTRQLLEREARRQASIAAFLLLRPPGVTGQSGPCRMRLRLWTPSELQFGGRTPGAWQTRCPKRCHLLQQAYLTRHWSKPATAARPVCLKRGKGQLSIRAAAPLVRAAAGVASGRRWAGQTRGAGGARSTTPCPAARAWSCLQ
mmetsp:Transcript_10290/g.40001  ORF Transcript_10290/g.40001 Transcript_10290/m.40001 type:complete len:265 (-) Transcript_10290:2331-3125(-)